MGAVTSRRGSPPEARRHLPAADGSPGFRQVSLIAAFIDQHRLPVSLLHFLNPGGLPGLPGHMRDIFPSRVIGPEAVVASQQMLSTDDVLEILKINLIGVIPESQDIIMASNAGAPVILTEKSNAAAAYQDTVERILNPNQDIPFRFTVEEKKKGFLSKLFRKK